MKLVEIILDVVHQDAIAEGREILFQLPISIDCYNDIKTKFEETLKLLKELESTVKSTDYEVQAICEILPTPQHLSS